MEIGYLSPTRALQKVTPEQAEKALPEVLQEMDKEKWDYYLTLIEPDGRFRIKNLNLTDKNYSKWEFSRIEFNECKFKNCQFLESKFEAISFNKCDFNECNFSNSKAPRTTIGSVNFFHCSSYKSIFDNMYISNSSIHNSNFFLCEFKKANLININIYDVNFKQCNFQMCSFESSNMRKVTWDESKINDSTDLFDVVFKQPEYSIAHDKSESMILDKGKYTSWKRVRFLSTIPLFEVSWVALIISLAIVNLTALLNKTQLIEFFNYPIPLPQNIFFVILSAILLTIGTTIYKIKCPDIVKDFTESSWVFEHSQPRPKYLIETLQHIGWRRASIFFIVTGGIIAGLLISKRIVTAFIYISQNM